MDALADALGQLSFVVQNALAEVAGAHDLSVIQTRLLGVLRDREPTMNALGRHLGLDKSSISGLVDRAQRRGLVARRASTTDRRAQHVSLTDAGRRLAEELEARFTERIAVIVAPLSDSDQRILTDLAARLADADTRSSSPNN